MLGVNMYTCTYIHALSISERNHGYIVAVSTWESQAKDKTNIAIVTSSLKPGVRPSKVSAGLCHLGV